MIERPKLFAALYGVAFHAVAAAVVALVAWKNRTGIPASFFATTVPPLLVAAAAVYAIVVGPYLPRRTTTRGAVFFDSAVGMMAEIGVVTLTGILYGALVALFSPLDGVGFLATAANTAFVAVFWALSEVFTQVLVVGNAAGLLLWLLLKKLAERRARAAAAP